jgi:hypothetical protein
MRSERAARDLRAYARGTTGRLILGGLVLVLIVGTALIAWLYGPRAATTGLLCSGVFLLPVLLIWGILALMGWAVRRSRKE